MSTLLLNLTPQERPQVNIECPGKAAKVTVSEKREGREKQKVRRGRVCVQSSHPPFPKKCDNITEGTHLKAIIIPFQKHGGLKGDIREV